MLRGRRVKSRPFTQGRTTFAFDRPSGFGWVIIQAARSASMSKGPPFVSPMNEMPRFSLRRCARDRSRPDVRLALIDGTARPSSSRSLSDPSSCPMKLM